MERKGEGHEVSIIQKGKRKFPQIITFVLDVRLSLAHHKEDKKDPLRMCLIPNKKGIIFYTC